MWKQFYYSWKDLRQAHLIFVVLYMSFLKPNIPHICQFWYTATLLRPVKSTPKSAYVRDKIAKIGQSEPKKKGQNAVHTIFRLACSCDLYELCTQNVCTHKMKAFFLQNLLFLYKSIIAYLYNHILKPSYIPPSIFVRPTCMYRGR